MKLRCPLSCVPVRDQASDSSEMVSQVLYGECVEVLAEEKKWMKVKCAWDDYRGWIAKEHEFENSIVDKHELTRRAGVLKADEGLIQISPGSCLSKLEFESFSEFPTKEYHSDDSLLRLAHQFLGTPYLWGGRSIWGIDCSGYMQVIFAMTGIPLPRDASQQAQIGELIDFDNRQSGDLAFFNNPAGKITHVGLLLDQEHIIHASGKVRVDRLDSEGIIRSTDTERTHFLHSIKRVRT